MINKQVDMGTVRSILLNTIVTPFRATSDASIDTTDPQKSEFPRVLLRSTLFDNLTQKIEAQPEIANILNVCTYVKAKRFEERLVKEINPLEVRWASVCDRLTLLLDFEVNKTGAILPNVAHNRNRTCRTRKTSSTDLIAFDKGGNFCPIEIKPFWVLNSVMSASAHNLCATYSTDLKHENSTKHSEWVRYVSQTVGYMMTEQCVFGLLMTYNFFYVLHFHYGPDDNIHAVYITDRVDCSEREYLLKFAYVMLLAQRCTYSPPPNITVTDIITDSESKPSDSFVSCTPLDYEEVKAMERVGEGRSGTVFMLPSKDAERGVDAVKLVDYKHPEAIRRLRREDQVYEAKKYLQGLLIPRIIDRVSCYGNAIGLRMNFIQCLDDDVSKWSGDDKERAVETLMKLAQHGLFQNDLEGRHFGYDEHGHLVMFDLEDVHMLDETQVTMEMLNEYMEGVVRMFV